MVFGLESANGFRALVPVISESPVFSFSKGPITEHPIMPTKLILLVSLTLTSFSAGAENNIRFLDKKIIRNLSASVYEVVVPKLESEQIAYARELPFEKLSYKERNEKFHSIGTAFSINEKELMTAAHVFDLEYFSLKKDFHIRDTTGEIYKVGRIKNYSTIRDMTVFELEQYPPNVMPLKFSNTTEIGNTVFSVGNAQGEGISFRAGQVASFTNEPEFGEWKNIRFTSPASPGNSGGPLIDINGDVLGVITQKNNSENYNVAVPISEAEKLGDKAIFHINDVSMYLNDEQNSVVEDWNESVDLPSNIDTLSGKAQDSLNAFYSEISRRLTDKYESTYFPKGKGFRSYLRKQLNVRGFGVLRSDADFKKWTVNNYSDRVVPVGENQDVLISRSDFSTLHVIIEKPVDVTLAEFLASPKLVLDNMLKAVPLKRKIGSKKIRIISLGEAESSRTWEDKLGRKWISSLWFLPYIDGFVYSHCLSYPSGAICNIDIKENSQLKTGYLNDIEDNLNEIAIGYEGDISSWVEYFSLDRKYLPEIFEGTRMKLADGVFHLDTHQFRIEFGHKNIKGASSLHFHFGYSNKSLLAEDLLLFEIFPRKGVRSHYRVQSFFSPNVFSSDNHKSQWDDIADQSGDYSGKVVAQDGQRQIRRVMSETGDSFTSPDGDPIERVFVAGCFFRSSQEAAVSKCDTFVDSLRFVDNP